MWSRTRGASTNRRSFRDSFEEESDEGIERVLVHVINYRELNQQKVEPCSLLANRGVDIPSFIDGHFLLLGLTNLPANKDKEVDEGRREGREAPAIHLGLHFSRSFGSLFEPCDEFSITENVFRSIAEPLQQLILQFAQLWYGKKKNEMVINQAGSWTQKGNRQT